MLKWHYTNPLKYVWNMEYNVSMNEWMQNIHLDVLPPIQSITTRYTLDNTPPTAHCPPGCRQPTDPSSGSGAPPGPARPHPATGDRGGDSAWSGRWLQHSGWDRCHPNTSRRQMNLHLKTYSISISVSNGLHKTNRIQKSHLLLPFPCASGQ